MHELIMRQLEIAAKIPVYARSHWQTLLVRGLVVAVAITLVVVFGKSLEAQIPAFEHWLKGESGVWMVIIFSLIFILAVLLCFPADVFAFAAGTLFGLGWGFLLAMVVEYIVLVLEFFIARFLLKKPMERFMHRHPNFQAIDKAINRNGLRIGFLLRLGPIPFGPLGYVLGASRMSFGTYMLTSIGMLPSLFPVVYYGFVARHLTKFATGAEDFGWLHYTFQIISVVVMIVLTVYIARVARQALQEAKAL